MKTRSTNLHSALFAPSPRFGRSALLAMTAAVATVVAACGGGHAAVMSVKAPADLDSAPPSTKAQTKSDPAMADCHQKFVPASKDADVSSDVDAMAKGCAAATKMHVVGSTMTGDLTNGGGAATFPMHGDAGHCYRVYAISQTSIQDLDLTILDSGGAVVARDTTEDVSPVIMEDGRVCYTASDDGTLYVTPGAGGGKFAAQVWSD